MLSVSLRRSGKIGISPRHGTLGVISFLTSIRAISNMNKPKILDLNENSKLLSSIDLVLKNNDLLTLATVDEKGDPHVNTCYFASDDKLNLYVLTPPLARHSQYAALHPECAVNIVDSRHKLGDPITGLQLSGLLSQTNPASALIAFDSYTKKHPKFLEYASDLSVVMERFESRFFKFVIEGGQLIDEPNFGAENYIRFQVKCQ